jgi:hypothetical protein
MNWHGEPSGRLEQIEEVGPGFRLVSDHKTCVQPRARRVLRVVALNATRHAATVAFVKPGLGSWKSVAWAQSQSMCAFQRSGSYALRAANNGLQKFVLLVRAISS